MTQSRDIAIRSRERLSRHDNEAMRELITDTMCAWSNFDDWMIVFHDDEDMLKRFKDNKHKIWVREPLIIDYIEGR